MSPDDLANRFQFHSAAGKPDTQLAHESVRSNCGDLARALNDIVPEGREKSLAITHLETVMFWANAAIARQG